MRTRATLVALGGAAALLVGCTATPGPTSPSPRTQTQAPLPTVPALGNQKGAAADVVLTTCGTKPGEQTAKGTLTNSSKSVLAYTITISWVNEGSTVLQRGVALIESAPPGKRLEWKVTATVPGGVTGCTMQVFRGDRSTR